MILGRYVGFQVTDHAEGVIMTEVTVVAEARHSDRFNWKWVGADSLGPSIRSENPVDVPSSRPSK